MENDVCPSCQQKLDLTRGYELIRKQNLALVHEIMNLEAKYFKLCCETSNESEKGIEKPR